MVLEAPGLSPIKSNNYWNLEIQFTLWLCIIWNVRASRGIVSRRYFIRLLLWVFCAKANSSAYGNKVGEKKWVLILSPFSYKERKPTPDDITLVIDIAVILNDLNKKVTKCCLKCWDSALCLYFRWRLQMVKNHSTQKLYYIALVFGWFDLVH